MNKQNCDLSVLTMEVVKDSLPRAMDLKIDLGFEGPDTGAAIVHGNPILLKELVRNLIDNALNYTPSNMQLPSVVTARVSGSEETGWQLEVEDSGPGIPAAEREQIFRPFYRALGTQVDGSGLGLAIVMEVAQQHVANVNVQDA
jgi:two-component system sensor histidine kinase TctE